MITFKTSKNFKKLLSTAIIFFSLMINQSVLAEVSATAKSNLSGSRIVYHDVYTYDLQLVDPEILSENVKKFKNHLILQQIQFKNLVKDKQFDSGDTVISLIMPGGFLYASYRMYEQKNAQKSLQMTTTDINDLYDDLEILSDVISKRSILIALIDINTRNSL